MLNRNMESWLSMVGAATILNDIRYLGCMPRVPVNNTAGTCSTLVVLPKIIIYIDYLIQNIITQSGWVFMTGDTRNTLHGHPVS